MVRPADRTFWALDLLKVYESLSQMMLCARMNRQEMILLLPLLVDAWIDDTMFFGCSGFSFKNNSNIQYDDELMTLVKSLCPWSK